MDRKVMALFVAGFASTVIVLRILQAIGFQV